MRPTGGQGIRHTLYELVSTYFRQRGYQIEEDPLLEGNSGIPHKFHLLIKKGNQQHLVKVLDWKRTVGVNMVINMDRASADVGFHNPIMTSEKFSGHAKAYANRRGVKLLTKLEIIRGLG
ncbi:MAG: hypothetical protein AOA65_1932 [Candidatus Bathyarchaeota archaeon BA1]|nr:MAG: hypothetical protein AOA65_1932 [Candidatus Bathyarchaeota archaeon BA1]